MSTGSGRSGLDLEKFTLSVLPQRRQIELYLLLNTNRISFASSICHNQWYRLITGKKRARLFSSSARLPPSAGGEGADRVALLIFTLRSESSGEVVPVRRVESVRKAV